MIEVCFFIDFFVKKCQFLPEFEFQKAFDFSVEENIAIKIYSFLFDTCRFKAITKTDQTQDITDSKMSIEIFSFSFAAT